MAEAAIQVATRPSRFPGRNGQARQIGHGERQKKA